MTSLPQDSVVSVPETQLEEDEGTNVQQNVAPKKPEDKEEEEDEDEEEDEEEDDDDDDEEEDDEEKNDDVEQQQAQGDGQKVAEREAEREAEPGQEEEVREKKDSPNGNQQSVASAPQSRDLALLDEEILESKRLMTTLDSQILALRKVGIFKQFFFAIHFYFFYFIFMYSVIRKTQKSKKKLMKLRKLPYDCRGKYPKKHELPAWMRKTRKKRPVNQDLPKQRQRKKKPLKATMRLRLICKMRHAISFEI